MKPALLQEWIARLALHSDMEAYKHLFGFYYPRLVSFSMAITKCKESSEETVSDVFLKIWNKREELLRIENIHLYFYISTKNASINALAKQQRSQHFSLDATHAEIESMQYNPEKLLLTREMFKRIQEAIQTLPPKCRLIFKLVKEDNLTYKEVAELLQLSVKTIEKQMGIAMRKLGASVQLRQFALS